MVEAAGDEMDESSWLRIATRESIPCGGFASAFVLDQRMMTESIRASKWQYSPVISSSAYLHTDAGRFTRWSNQPRENIHKCALAEFLGLSVASDVFFWGGRGAFRGSVVNVKETHFVFHSRLWL